MSHCPPPVTGVSFFLEEVTPPSGPARGWTLGGWIFGQADTRCCGVRARHDAYAVNGIFGLPRPDVATAYPADPPAGFSGFRCTFPRRRRVALEWQDTAGNWREFWRGEMPASAANRSRESPSRPVLPSRLLPVLLEAIRGKTRALSWSAAWEATHHLLVDYSAAPAPTPAPASLRLSIDQPGENFPPGRVHPISGWIFQSDRPIKRLFAQLDPGGIAHVVFPVARRDVAKIHADLGAPETCGFTGTLLLPENTPSFTLRLYAEYRDGSLVLAGSRRCFCQAATNAPAGYARALRLLGAMALAGAWRPESWRGAWRQLRQSWRPKRPTTANRGVKLTAPPFAAESTPASRIGAAQHGDPLISMVVPVFNPSERHLREMIASVQAQSYGRWELCLADDASTAPHVRPVLEEYARTDPRIRVVFRPSNGHIARASNTALELARGRFVALVDHDDLLPPDALLRVVEALRLHPDARFFYTNRDKVDDHGRHFDPENRGAWNPAAAMTHNYLHHLTVICRELVQQAGAFRADYFGSQDLDLYLRCHELVAPEQIVHVPVIGYHWRAHAGSTASRGDQKDYMFDSARRAIADAMRRRGLRASPFLPDFGPVYGMNLHQLRWDPSVLREQRLSAVVAVTPATRAQLPFCLADLRAACSAEAIQIIVVSAGEPVFVANGDHVETIAASAEASLAALYNLGAARARFPLLLLLDAAARFDTADGLEDLAGWLGAPAVAAVGPKLVGHDGLLASAAWTIGHKSGLPQPVSAGAPVGELVPPFLAHAARDTLLLDPRCILTHTVVFRELDGYDARHFPERYFAADFCLRLHDRNRRVVFTPQAVVSVGPANRPGAPATDEDRAFLQRHSGRADPWILPPPPNDDLDARMRAGPFRNDWMPANTVASRDGWFFLERPFPWEKIQAGHQVLNGWYIGRAGHAAGDLRVRSDGRIHPVEAGFPRPDLAVLVGKPDTLFPAGFNVELDLPSGPARLEFEACLDDGNWRSVAIVEFTVGHTHVPSRPDRKQLVSPDQFEHLADLALRQAADLPMTQLARRIDQLADDAECFRHKRYAREPFRGFIDQPMPVFVPFYGEIGVLGWIFHERQAIRRLAISFDSNSWQEIACDQASPEIGARYPEFPAAAHCAFQARVTVPQHLPQPLLLRVWAELDDGTWHLVFALRCRAEPVPVTDASALHGASAARLVATVAALRVAFLRRGVGAPGGLSLVAILRSLRRSWPALATPSPKLPPFRPGAAPFRPHLLLVTHNLNREGAPLFLLEFAACCREHLAAAITVVSPLEGPLRADFEALGIGVRLVDRAPLWSAHTAAAARDALDRLGVELHAENATVVIANTVESFWAIPAAQRAGRPALFYVHEPGILGLHYLGHLPVEVRRAAAATFAEARLVSFLNRATQSYYLGLSSGGNYRIQPGWTRLTPVDALPSPAARATGRARLGFAPDDLVVINVGTLCPRKGQLFFVQAIERLWTIQPELAARCRFLMIGAHDSVYGDAVATRLAHLGRSNIAILPPTNRVREYFAAADLFVLTSFEEGFSRVLLEAMDFGLPIVGTAIHGLPEIARHEREALMVPAADAPALADAMQRLLQDERLAAQLGSAARARLESTYPSDRVLPDHLATLRSLAPELAATRRPTELVAHVGLTGS